MRSETKTIFTKKYIYRLNYKLTVNMGIFTVHIESEKYEKEKFFSLKHSLPCACERSRCELPKMGYSEANSFFEQITDNLVFPCSLTYIVEDLEIDCKNEVTDKSVI